MKFLLVALKKHFNDIKTIELSTQIDRIDTPFTLNDFNIRKKKKNLLLKNAENLLFF